MYPDWLPDPIVLNGTLAEDYDRLHDIFLEQIVGANLSIEDVDIIVDTHPDREMSQYEAGFMHLVTRSDGYGLRTIDYVRATKLVWIPSVIANYKQPEVYSFWYDTPKGETLCLWMPDYDYSIVMRWTNKKRKKKIIVTAYAIDKYNRKSFQNYYARATRVL